MNDKGIQIFTHITDLRDELILESDIRAGAAVLPYRRRVWAYLASGWGVAILCAVVSLGLVVSMLMMGRGNGDQILPPPALDTGTTETTATKSTDPDEPTNTDEPIDTDESVLIPEDTEKPADGESAPRLTDYDAVLNAARSIARICTEHTDASQRQEVYEKAFVGVDEKDKAICDRLFLAISDLGGDESSFGYVERNVNGASGRELVLLGADYTLLAILSETDGGIVLLDAFHAAYQGYINKAGLLVTGGTDGSGKRGTWTYRIAPGDESLILVSERDDAGLQSVSSVASAQNTRSLGVYYTPMFGEPADRTEEVNLAKRLYRERVMEFYDQWGPDPYIPARVILIDMNEDGMPEAIVDHGCSVYVLYYYEGNIYEMFVANTDNAGLYGLKVDGTAGWESGGTNLYGNRRLLINSGCAEWVDLWSVRDSKIFYVQGVEVTKAEFIAYDDALCKEHAEWHGWSKEEIEKCFA